MNTLSELTCIKFGREHYHLRHKMETWLYERYGEGLWYYPEGLWYYPGYEDNPVNPANEAIQWFQNEMFGYSEYYFRNDNDAVMFALKWA